MDESEQNCTPHRQIAVVRLSGRQFCFDILRLDWGAMKRTVLVYGLIGGVLITVLQWSQYRFLVIEHSLEVYGGLTAATFAVLGIWLGMRLRGARSSEQGTGSSEQWTVDSEQSAATGDPTVAALPTRAAEGFVLDERRREGLGI